MPSMKIPVIVKNNVESIVTPYISYNKFIKEIFILNTMLTLILHYCVV